MAHEHGQAKHTVEPFSAMRRQQVDWLDLMQRQHTIHALLEADITAARRSLAAMADETGRLVSFTAYIAWCVAQAVDADRQLHACRLGRNRLVLFDDVDVTVLIERVVGAQRIPLPHIIRAANKKTLAEINSEFRAVQSSEVQRSNDHRGLSLWLAFPACFRRWVWTVVMGNPQRRKRLMGTVAVSAIGMFGHDSQLTTGGAWGIPLTAYTLCVIVGGIATKPGAVPDPDNPAAARIELREQLSFTLSMDHAIVDGAPAARFGHRLRQLIEAGPPAD